MENLRKIFLNIVNHLGNPEKVGNTWTEIVARYKTPPRFYHTFEGHISFCLREMEIAPINLIHNKEAVAMALLLHDAVMDFSRSDNEKQSAILALHLGQQLEIPIPFLRLVARLIRATKHHYQCDSENQDQKIVMDIDLAILGQKQDDFNKYEKNIRREYAFVPEVLFKSQRVAILESFLQRPFIYQTKYFQEKYESQARQNLALSINKLRE